MKLSVVNTLAGILSGISLNRIADKDVKNALLNDYFALRKLAKEADNDKEEMIKKFQDDWKDEIKAVRSFRSQGRPVVGHLDYLDAERDANQGVLNLYAKEVEVTIQPVPLDAFLDACEGEDLTLEQIAALQEGGVIK